MKIAIIGCGRIARAHFMAIQATPALMLHAVADSDVEAARALAQLAASKYFEGHRALLESAPPDIAVVCTPPSTHAAIVADCLHAGAHVLCEKPLGIAPHEVEALNAQAVACRRALMMASKLRFVPKVQQARVDIENNRLGDITSYQSTLTVLVEMSGRMNARRALSGGGVVMDNGPHAFDLARFLVGELAQVRAEFPPNRQAIEVEDSAHIEFQTRAMPKLTGEIQLSWSEAAASDRFVEIGGSRGAISLGWNDYDKAEAFALQMQHFVQVARGQSAPLVSPCDALANAQAIAAAYRAQQSGDWCALESEAELELK